MKTLSKITGEYYEDEDCVFFRNPLQSAYYVFREGKLVDLFVGSDLKFVFVFNKETHNRLKQEWGSRKREFGVPN